MTPADALGRVEEIRTMAGDPEAAHGAEDDFVRDVLRAIRNGEHYPALLASIALSSFDIEFPRWTA